MEYSISKIRDKIRIFEKNGKFVSTNFLTPAEIQEAISILRGYDYCIYGGFEEAERRIIIIGIKECIISEFCSALRVIGKNDTHSVGFSHRDVLGSVLGLGIKREMIGDIIVSENQCDIVVMQEMEKYILNNLSKIGNEKVSVNKINFDEIKKIDDNKNFQNISVASLRLDAIISAGLGISREKSSNLICNEKVLINYLLCKNISKSVKENDLISIRGFGRIKISKILGETRKGRIRLEIQKWK